VGLGKAGPTLLWPPAWELHGQTSALAMGRPLLVMRRMRRARLGSRQESRVDLGRARRTRESRPGHPRRQGLPGQHLGEGPVQGPGQAGTAERGKSRPREAPRPRRRGKRPAQGGGRSSASYAAARGGQENSRRPSTFCSFARHNQVGISSMYVLSRTIEYGLARLSRTLQACRRPVLGWEVAIVLWEIWSWRQWESGTAYDSRGCSRQ
jgi:hypothetical protein